MGQPPTPLNPTLPKVAFICVENSCRSQMAQAFAIMHGAGKIEAYSAGSTPSGVVNPTAINMMAERGHDLSRHTSTGIAELPEGPYAAVITMGCGDDACPHLHATIQEDWALADPKEMPDDQFRRVRDDIERRVVSLIARITMGSSSRSADGP